MSYAPRTAVFKATTTQAISTTKANYTLDVVIGGFTYSLPCKGDLVNVGMSTMYCDATFSGSAGNYTINLTLGYYAGSPLGRPAQLIFRSVSTLFPRTVLSI